jgi:hypothetical protein
MLTDWVCFASEFGDVSVCCAETVHESATKPTTIASSVSFFSIVAAFHRRGGVDREVGSGLDPGRSTAFTLGPRR